jgi:hypothetical protein
LVPRLVPGHAAAASALAGQPRPSVTSAPTTTKQQKTLWRHQRQTSYGGTAMAQIVKLTKVRDSKPIYVNAARVRTFEATAKGRTEIRFAEEDIELTVREDVEEVFRQLFAARE